MWLQSVRVLGPIDTGLVLMPLARCTFVVSASIGRFMHSLAPGRVIAAGPALIGVGALLRAHLGAGSGWGALIAGLLAGGIGVGLATPVLASAALSAVPLERGGMASGAVNTARQLDYALGITGLGVLCQSRIADRLRAVPGIHDATATARLLIGGQARALLARARAGHRRGRGGVAGVA